MEYNNKPYYYFSILNQRRQNISNNHNFNEYDYYYNEDFDWALNDTEESICDSCIGDKFSYNQFLIKFVDF